MNESPETFALSTPKTPRAQTYLRTGSELESESKFQAEHRLLFVWLRRLGISLWKWTPDGLVFDASGAAGYHGAVKALELVIYPFYEMMLLSRSLKLSAPMETILLHLVWINGPFYAFTPWIALMVQGKEWCAVLNEAMATKHRYLGGHFRHRCLLQNLRTSLIKIYIILGQLWMGSVMGMFLFCLVKPLSPVFWNVYLETTFLRHWIPPWLLQTLCTVDQVSNMYSGWGLVFLLNSSHYTVVKIISVCIKSFASNIPPRNSPLLRPALAQVLTAYKSLFILTRIYSNEFSWAIVLHMAQNVMQFWLIAYQQILLGLDIHPIYLMLFWANIYYEIAKILAIKIACDVSRESEAFLSLVSGRISEARALTTFERKYLRALLAGCAPASVKYWRFGRMSSGSVLIVLNIALSNLIVLLKL